MMQPVYILSASAISPQHSFTQEQFGQQVMHTADGKLFVADPDYREFVNPVAIRRMSRLIKMGITAGMKCLQQAGVEKPDAIITGTGLGSMTDTEQFLKDMIRLEEQALNPTYFIQSTYNSINGWLALQTKSTGYNQTYVHRGCSLELSLLDAQLLLQESTERTCALTGCFDELTHDYFIVKSKVDYWKKQLPDSLDLLGHTDTPGTIAGEGAAFFALSNYPDNALCILKGVKMLQDHVADQTAAEINSFLKEYGLTADNVDTVICGMNGDGRDQGIYEQALEIIPKTASIAVFKHLTGEYPTASGFALWLATRIFATKEIPEVTVYRQGITTSPKDLLIINHYILGSVSLMLLSATGV